MGEKDPLDSNKSPLFRIDLNKKPKTGFRDFLKQKNEAQKAERERRKAEEQARREAEALESIPVKDHPLRKMPADFIDLYVKSVLILRAEVPPEYSDPEDEKKQLRLFARSLGLTREHQSQLEQEASRCDDRGKTETLLKLASSRCDKGVMTCFLCDVARLHGEGYKFEGDFADVWRDVGGGIAELSDEELAAAEKLCRDIVSGGKLASPERYAPIAKALVYYFGLEAFATAGKYLVIDLSGGAGAKRYPFRLTDGKPDLFNDACRTTELWLRRIPAGTFTMGDKDNGSAHKVTLSQDYYLGVFPVTQKQWELVMGDNPSHFKEVGPGAPVEEVSYDDICGASRPWPKDASVSPGSFLGKLRAKTRLAGFDLPTEAQWEYACRAGTTTKYSFGDSIEPSQVNFDKAIGKTTCVGSYPANAWRLYDMHGNVWEWCRDWYEEYAGGEATDPTGPSSGSRRVARGGGWDDFAGRCRSALRNGGGYPGKRSIYLGFRLAFVPGQ